MLSVGVDAAAIGVAAFRGGAVTSGDSRSQAAVLAEGENVGAVRPGDCSRFVGRAVVDDEQIRLRELLGELRQDGAEVVLLVPGGDEDERVGHGRRVAAVAQSPGSPVDNARTTWSCSQESQPYSASSGACGSSGSKASYVSSVTSSCVP